MRERPKVTLFEKWTNRVPKIENQVYNPLESLLVGSNITIDKFGISEYRFKVTEVVDRTWNIGEEQFSACQYLVTGVSLKSDSDLKLELRVFPNETKPGGLFVLLLEMEEETSWEENMVEFIERSYNTGKSLDFLDSEQADGVARDENGDPLQFFPALEGMNLVRKVQTLSLRDKDKDGTVEEEELAEGRLLEYEFLRYCTVSGLTEKQVEYLIFDMVTESNRVLLIRRYRGHEIYLSAVKL